MRLPILLVLPLVVVAAARPTAAQTPVIRELLGTSRAVAANYGWLRIDWAWGDLHDDYHHDVTANLQPYTTYHVVGVCDRDCSDLDLKVLGPDGNLVVQDVATDDSPIVTFTTGGDGAYTIRVIMASCHVEPCGWGINLFRRGPSALAPSPSAPLYVGIRASLPRAPARPGGSDLAL